jgi:hypothetical protein
MRTYTRARRQRRTHARNQERTLKEFLTDAVFVRAGEGSIQLGDSDPVHIAVMFDVHGYGPHPGAIYVDQNRYHASADTALQAADELLEEHEMEAHADHLRELEEEHGDEALSVFTETFDGRTWELSAEEAARNIEGTDAAKFIDIYPAEDDDYESNDQYSPFAEGDVEAGRRKCRPGCKCERHRPAERLTPNMSDQEFRDRIEEEVEAVLGKADAERALLRYESIWYSGDASTTTPRRVADELVAAYRRSPGAQRLTPNQDIVRDEIVGAAARAFFVTVWADEAEREAEEGDGELPWGAGEDIDDAAPDTPEEAQRFGERFVFAVEKLNAASITELYDRAAEAPGRHLRQPEPEDFGHYLAMQAMGHGVAWQDDHPPAGLSAPEAHWYGDSGEIDDRFIFEA